MGNCLVTKLKSSISNPEILKLGEMRIHFDKVSAPTDITQGFSISANKPINLEIIGDGYFTDKTLSENKGKTLTLVAETVTDIWVSNNDLDVSILDKYSLTSISVNYKGSSASTAGKNKRLNIEDLKYSNALSDLLLKNAQVSGDISALEGHNSISKLNLSGTQVKGDISSLKNNSVFYELNLSGTQISGDISALKNNTGIQYLSCTNTQISGDISALKNNTGMVFLTLGNTQTNGDIGSLSTMTNLEYMYMINTKVSGDIGKLKTLTKLTSLLVFNKTTPLTGNISELSTMSNLIEANLSYSRLSGDLSKFPASYVLFSNDAGSTFTWTTRPSSANILSIEGGASLSNIDKMLQDQAQCQIPTSSVSRIIAVAGNRTSASDDAVATLQQKGYTISIAKA